MPAPDIPSAAESAPAALERELERVTRLHAERNADPALAAALDELARWQAARLRRTYADLEAVPRYTAAVDPAYDDLDVLKGRARCAVAAGILDGQHRELRAPPLAEVADFGTHRYAATIALRNQTAVRARIALEIAREQTK